MAIVTISRGSASGGRLLAEKLGERLGYEVVSREDTIRDAASYGVGEHELREAILRPVSFWDRFDNQRRRYLALVQAALCERAQHDRIVYHGNAGHLLLHGVSHVLCIRLIASTSFRIQKTMEHLDLSRDEAVRYIEAADFQRKEWTRFLYGEDWLDPNRYDLTVNLKTLTLEGAVEVAASAAQRREFEPTQQSRQALANLVVESRVRAALAADVRTAAIEVGVWAEDGVVHLKGRVFPASVAETVLDVARRVEGVREVDRRALETAG